MAEDYLNDPAYQTGLTNLDTADQLSRDTINQQRTNVGISYDQNRNNVIKGYQDALDAINYSSKQAGIGLRQDYADRNLYNASGEVSGIGQNVGANVMEPLARQTRQTYDAYTQGLSGVESQRTSALGDLNLQERGIGVARADKNQQLIDTILGRIRASAADQRAGAAEQRAVAGEAREAASFKTPEQKLALGASEDRKNRITQEQSRGRTYISSQKALAKAKKEGKTVIKIGNDLFTLSPEEETMQRQREVNLYQDVNKKPGGPKPSALGTTRTVKDSEGGTQFQRKNKDGSYSNVTAQQYATQNGLSIVDVLSKSKDKGSENAINEYNKTLQLINGGQKTPEEGYEYLVKKMPWIFKED